MGHVGDASYSMTLPQADPGWLIHAGEADRRLTPHSTDPPLTAGKRAFQRRFLFDPALHAAWYRRPQEAERYYLIGWLGSLSALPTTTLPSPTTPTPTTLLTYRCACGNTCRLTTDVGGFGVNIIGAIQFRCGVCGQVETIGAAIWPNPAGKESSHVQS